MYNLRIILLINFFIGTYVPFSESRATLYYQPISEKTAVDSLIEIQTSQVLPLALLVNKDQMEFQYSASLQLEKIFVQNGRIINGTQFTSEKNHEQVLFCPKENSDDNCLIPKDFQGLEPLQCAKESTPVVQEEPNFFCGVYDIGKPYSVIYKLCSREESKNNDDERMDLYVFCYDDFHQKTIFTTHIIENTELLDSEVLRQEHNVKYSYNMEITSELIPSNIQELKEALAQEESNSTTTETQLQGEDQNIPKHIYKIQKLIPDEEMAFASWSKSTYYYFNAELQHEKLILLWNEMNKYIRNEAKRMYSIGVKFSVSTGVFDLTPTPREDGQKSNVWTKMIFAIHEENGRFKEDALRGMVIMMDNFIEERVDHVASLNSAEPSIVDYCKDDSCDDTLRKNFEKVGGRVRCCSVSAEIEEIFHWDANRVDMAEKDYVIPPLRIPGINEVIEKNPFE